jgi:hypothetical protein
MAQAAPAVIPVVVDPNQERLNKRMTELPNFYGDASKDMISPLAFYERVEACKFNMNWSDQITYNYFAMALQDEAQRWLIARKSSAKIAFKET